MVPLPAPRSIAVLASGRIPAMKSSRNRVPPSILVPPKVAPCAHSQRSASRWYSLRGKLEDGPSGRGVRTVMGRDFRQALPGVMSTKFLASTVFMATLRCLIRPPAKTCTAADAWALISSATSATSSRLRGNCHSTTSASANNSAPNGSEVYTFSKSARAALAASASSPESPSCCTRKLVNPCTVAAASVKAP